MLYVHETYNKEQENDCDINFVNPYTLHSFIHDLIGRREGFYWVYFPPNFSLLVHIDSLQLLPS